MYDVKFVHKLCERISVEEDAEKIQDMLALVVALMRDNREEVWLRMTFLEQKYALTFDKVTPNGDLDD